MSLNSRNRALAAFTVLLCSFSSQAENPPAEPEPGEQVLADPGRSDPAATQTPTDDPLPTITITARSDDIDDMAAQIKQGVRQQVQHALSHLSQPPESARASTWDVLILDAQRAYWEATRDNADAQTGALLALRTLTAAQKGASITTPAPGGMTPLPRTNEAPTFDWTLVSVGRGADGRPYAMLRDGAARKRIAHQARLDGWTITISPTGTVTAQHGGLRVELG